MSYTVVPDYDELSRRVHGLDFSELSAVQQEVLGRALRAAESALADSHPHKLATPEMAQAVLLMGKRLIVRDNAPDGVSGWQEDGSPLRFAYRDPDVLTLLGPARRKLVYR